MDFITLLAGDTSALATALTASAGLGLSTLAIVTCGYCVVALFDFAYNTGLVSR